MKWGKYAFASMLFALVFFLSPAVAPKALAATTLDQCKANPKLPDCVSFDPKVNPILSNAELTYNSASNGKVYKNSAGLQCVDYTGSLLASYAPSTGCIQADGTFKIDGVDIPLGQASAAAGNVTTAPDLTETTAQGTKNIPVSEAAASGGSCSIFSWSGLVSCMGDIVAAIEWIILLVVSAILGIANYLLGWTVYVTVYQFGNLIGNSQGLLAAWGAVRDVANILLLFGFIFMGISTILNLPHSEFTAKRALPTLIIFALLLNFSLLAAEAVIDVSNAFAVSIYNQIGCGDIGKDGLSDQKCIVDHGIGGRVMQMSGLTGIWHFDKDTAIPDGTTRAIVYGGLIVFAIVTTIVIFAAAVMLIIRAVMLALLMVTAPLGFAGMAVPPLHEMAKKWWTQLIHQAFFAPIYFLLAFVSISVMAGIIQSLGGNPQKDTLAAMFSAANSAGGTSNITIGITFALLIGFMIASLVFAKQSSAIGTSTAISAGGSFAFGTLGWVGRNTAGRASLGVANRIRTSSFGQTGLGRMAFNVANKGASSSFDYRQGGLGRGALTGAVGSLGDVRKSVQHGMHGIEEDSQKAKADYAKKIGQTHHEQVEQQELELERDGGVDDQGNHHEGINDRIRAIENQRAGGLNQAQTAVTNAQQAAALRSANDGRQIEQVRSQLNQAVAAGDMNGAAAIQGQLTGMIQADAQARQQEAANIAALQQAVQAYQQQTNQQTEPLRRRVQEIGAIINGGIVRDAQGNITAQHEGISADAKRRRYGRNLKTSFAATHAPGTIMGHTDWEAGRDVIRNAGRTGIERAIHDLQGHLNQGPQGGGGTAGGAAGGHAPAGGAHAPHAP